MVAIILFSCFRRDPWVLVPPRGHRDSLRLRGDVTPPEVMLMSTSETAFLLLSAVEGDVKPVVNKAPPLLTAT